MKKITVIAILLALLLSVTATAEPVIERPAPGEGIFLVVLGGTGAEPDYSALGGHLIRSWSDRRLIAIPQESLETLKEHARVRYVQRVWTGESDDALAMTTQSQATRIRTEAGTPVPAWNSTYVYDPSGNVQSIARTGADQQFGYDAVGRLRHFTAPDTTQNFSYDIYGNLTAIGSGALNVDASTNRLSTGFTYDGAGRMTADADGRQYQYDATGMLTLMDAPAGAEVDGDRRMIYTAADERIAVAGATTTTYRVRDFAAHVLREWTSTTNTTLQWERDYLYAGGALIAGEVQTDQLHNGMRHYHTDHLGSIRLVTNGAAELVSQHDYYPFGAEFTPTISEFTNTGHLTRDPAKFTGHERDYLTGGNQEGDALDYMHARVYAPKWGRFLSVDPVMDAERALLSPQRWNRYAYARNNPIRAIDPDGRDELDIVQGAVNAFTHDMFLGQVPRLNGNADFESGKQLGDLFALAVNSAEVVGGANGTVASFVLDATGVGALAGAPAGVITAAVVSHGVASGTIAATYLSSSINQMNKEIKRGQAPSEVKRADRAKVKNEQDHVHFNDKDKSALNKDGTWKHGFTKLKNATKEWLEKHGWALP